MFNIKLAGENAIIIYFGDKISAELVERIAFYNHLLLDKLDELIIDVVTSYTSLMITYRIELINHQEFCKQVTEIVSKTNVVTISFVPDLIEIPVYYGFEVGLDLERLLIEKDLSLDEFTVLHSSKDYMVYAIGFSPAFAFLGEVDECISASRLKTPRIQIPAGSVGIADNQTAVYPVTSSGGWNIIGRTPLDLSINNQNKIKRFSVGNRVRFTAIGKAEYLDLGGLL